MRSLFAADKICLEPYGPPSRGTSKLALPNDLSNSLSNSLSCTCRTPVCGPPLYPRQLHSLPACKACGCLLRVKGRSSWLNAKTAITFGRYSCWQ